MLRALWNPTAIPAQQRSTCTICPSMQGCTNAEYLESMRAYKLSSIYVPGPTKWENGQPCTVGT